RFRRSGSNRHNWGLCSFSRLLRCGKPAESLRLPPSRRQTPWFESRMRLSGAHGWFRSTMRPADVTAALIGRTVHTLVNHRKQVRCRVWARYRIARLSVETGVEIATLMNMLMAYPPDPVEVRVPAPPATGTTGR